MRIELHLGVHKTATRHLQRYWQVCSQMPAANAVCPPLAEVRTNMTPVCTVPQGKGAQGRANDVARRAAATVWLEPYKASAQALVLSDENMIGSSERIFALRSLYASALPRLQRLAEALTGHQVRLWIAVREYTGFLRSAYCETLRHGPYKPFREQYTGLDFARGWEHVVGDVKQAFPRADLRCWRYESLSTQRGSISAEMFGLAPESLPPPDERRDRRALSRLAARLLDDIYTHVGPDDATRARASVERVLSGAGMPSFDPWEEAERESLNQAYERSITAIKGIPGVTWLG